MGTGTAQWQAALIVSKRKSRLHIARHKTLFKSRLQANSQQLKQV